MRKMRVVWSKSSEEACRENTRLLIAAPKSLSMSFSFPSMTNPSRARQFDRLDKENNFEGPISRWQFSALIARKVMESIKQNLPTATTPVSLMHFGLAECSMKEGAFPDSLFPIVDQLTKSEKNFRTSERVSLKSALDKIDEHLSNEELVSYFIVDVETIATTSSEDMKRLFSREFCNVFVLGDISELYEGQAKMKILYEEFKLAPKGCSLQILTTFDDLVPINIPLWVPKMERVNTWKRHLFFGSLRCPIEVTSTHAFKTMGDIYVAGTLDEPRLCEMSPMEQAFVAQIKFRKIRESAPPGYENVSEDFLATLAGALCDEKSCAVCNVASNRGDCAVLLPTLTSIGSNESKKSSMLLRLVFPPTNQCKEWRKVLNFEVDDESEEDKPERSHMTPPLGATDSVLMSSTTSKLLKAIECGDRGYFKAKMSKICKEFMAVGFDSSLLVNLLNAAKCEGDIAKDVEKWRKQLECTFK